MPKIKQENIAFFEVEDEDHAKVIKAFPKALIFKEPLNAKTVKKCKDAQVLCGMIYSEFSGPILKQIPNLKFIVTRSVGYNHIDLKWADEHKIPVCNVPDYGAHVIAEHVFALLLSSIRNVLEGEERTEHEKFFWKGLRGMALRGKTLGIVGTGKIGMHVARIASLGFQMEVLAYDPHPDLDKAKDYHFEYVKKIEEIWKKADVITLHVPLFPSTKHMINSKSIAMMQDGVCIINTARGELIDTKALIAALKKGKIGHAALDVIEHEKNIKEHSEILHYPGVIITPHIAFYADDSVKRMFSEGIDSIKRFLNGRDLIHQVKGH